MYIFIQNPEIIKQGSDAFERITNPILVILLLVFITIIFFGAKYFINVIREKDKIIALKDEENKKYTNTILDINKTDSSLVAELKTTLDKLIEADKSYASKIGLSNDLLQQLIAKTDLLISKLYNK